MHRPFVSRFPVQSLVALVVIGSGCGDDAVCPAGTAGNPCRYTVGVGDAPSVPRALDGSDAATSGDVESADPDLNDVDDDTEGPDGDDAVDDASLSQPPTPNIDAWAGLTPIPSARPDAWRGGRPARGSSATRPSEATAHNTPRSSRPHADERPVARASQRPLPHGVSA